MFNNVKKWMENSIVDEVLILAMLIALVESCAQNILKNSKHSTFKLIIGLLFYMLVGYILHWGYDNFSMSRLNISWSSLSILLGLILGFIYGESMNKWNVFAGVFAILAVYCASQ